MIPKKQGRGGQGNFNFFQTEGDFFYVMFSLIVICVWKFLEDQTENEAKGGKVGIV